MPRSACVPRTSSPSSWPSLLLYEGARECTKGSTISQFLMGKSDLAHRETDGFDYCGQVPVVGAAVAGLTEMTCTFGGIVGARVIATFSRPRSQAIVQSPRRAFSTWSKPDPARHAPTWACRFSIAARRRSLL